MRIKAKVGDIVSLKGRTANTMRFKRGIVRRIVKAGPSIRQTIFMVSRLKGTFTTPFLSPNITVSYTHLTLPTTPYV